MKHVFLILLLASCAWAQGGWYSDKALGRGTSNAVLVLPGATIKVCTDSNCNLPISVYSDEALSNSEGISVTADANGNFGFYAVPGIYFCQVSTPGFTTSTTTCQITPGRAVSLNGNRIVDGGAYPLSGTGIQSALNDQSSAGGGKVTIKSGTIAMGNTTLTMPSNVCLEGTAQTNQSILRWTSLPSGTSNFGIILPSGVQGACVKNLTLSFAAIPAGGIMLANSGTGPTNQFNRLMDIQVIFDSQTAAASCYALKGTTVPSNVSLNYLDNLSCQSAPQWGAITSAERNYIHSAMCTFCGIASGPAYMQLTDSTDNYIEFGCGSQGSVGGAPANQLCFSDDAASGLNTVNVICDNGNLTSTCVSDSGFNNSFNIAMLAGGALGLLSPSSTAIINPPTGTPAFHLPSATSDPTSMPSGSLAFRTDSSRIRFFDGSLWHSLPGIDTTDVLTNKSTSAGPLAGTVASGTATFTTTAVGAGACQTTVTVTATGAATTDAIETAYASAPTGTTDGMLVLNKWVTSGNVNFARCNPTAGSITPTALVLNWRVIR